MNFYSLTHLSDAALLSHDQSVEAQGCAVTAQRLASLGEIDARKLYLPAGHPSMHSWCVHVRRMSEDEASRRICAARVARRFPAVFAMVADGRLHLTAIVTLAPWLKLRPELGDELLAAAAHRSRVELEHLIAERFPQPDATARVVEQPHDVSNGTLLDSSAPARMPSGAFVSRPSRTALVAPLSPERYRIEYTFDQDDRDLLEYAKVLLSHQVPTGDVAEISRRALRALVGQLEKQMFGTGRPRKGPRGARDSRHVPRAVKAAVWKRDGGRCTFVGDHGQRCPARERLHFDHVVPVGRGGESDVANLRLLCAAHNQYEAGRVYGEAFMNGKREAAREARGRAPARPETASPGQEWAGEGHASFASQAPVSSEAEDSDAETARACSYARNGWSGPTRQSGNAPSNFVPSPIATAWRICSSMCFGMRA